MLASRAGTSSLAQAWHAGTKCQKMELAPPTFILLPCKVDEVGNNPTTREFIDVTNQTVEWDLVRIEQGEELIRVAHTHVEIKYGRIKCVLHEQVETHCASNEQQQINESKRSS